MKGRAFLWCSLLSAVSCDAGGGASREEHHGAAPAAAGEAAAPTGTISIRPEMLRDLRIRTAKAEARPAGEGVSVLGELKVNEDAYAEAGAPVPARVVRVLASPGDEVTQGQPIVELQSAELGKALSDFLSARAKAQLAQRTLERKRSLTGERIAAARELEEAEAEAAATEAGLRASRATLHALGLSEEDAEKSNQGGGNLVLRAPIAGTVIERAVVQGQFAEPSRVLFRIADLSRVWLTVHAFERDAVRVKLKTTARVTLPALPGRNFTGTVTLIGGQVEVSSRTIPVRIELSNKDGLFRPGMSATAWLPVGDADSSVIAVPAVSLQRMADGWCVFIPRDERTFEVRKVGRGRDLGGAVEIVSGLTAGETVVVDGAFLIKAEADKAAGEAGHHDD